MVGEQVGLGELHLSGAHSAPSESDSVIGLNLEPSGPLANGGVYASP
jgi:hypothetical protein